MTLLMILTIINLALYALAQLFVSFGFKPLEWFSCYTVPVFLVIAIYLFVQIAKRGDLPDGPELSRHIIGSTDEEADNRFTLGNAVSMILYQCIIFLIA